MKKLVYLIMAATLVFGSCKKDEKKPSTSSGSGGGSTVSNKVKTISGDSLFYNSSGILSKMKSGGSGYSRSYIWSAGLLTTNDSVNGVLFSTTSYTRNSAGYVSVSFSGGYTTSYSYDAAGHLTQEQYNSASSTLANVANYIWSGGNMTSVSYPQSASSTITYTFEYSGDKETRDVGLKYFPTQTSNFNSTANKNLVKSVKRTDVNYYENKYTYIKDSNGRVIQQTNIFYYMNGGSLDSNTYVTNYTYY